jgi:hypothetical protein
MNFRAISKETRLAARATHRWRKKRERTAS